MKLLRDTHVVLAVIQKQVEAFPAAIQRLLLDGLGTRLIPIDAPIDAQHMLVAVQPEPPTRDPFDRLLLAQCQVEGTASGREMIGA